MMAVFIPFAFFFAMAVLFRIAVSSAGKKYYKDFEKQIEEERLANFSRKQDIPKDTFIKPDLSKLPIKEYPEDDETFKRVIESQESVLRKGKLKMIKLIPPLSNIEIKKKFGFTNLEFVIEYEENYYSYISSLNMLAVSLINLKDFISAEKVLLHCIIDMQSNIFKSYVLLSEIYAKNNDKNKLEEMLNIINKLEVLKEDNSFKEKLEYHINKLIKEI